MLARRAGPLAALVAAVFLAHLWLADRVLPDRIGDGAADRTPARMAVTFVQTLQPAAPPRQAAGWPAPAAPAVARPPQRAASAATPDADDSSGPVQVSAPELPDFLRDDSPPVAMPAARAAEVSAAAVAGPARPPASAASGIAAAAVAAAVTDAAAFEWPPSTRLSYRLTGHYRGPVEGQAQVEWLRSGTRYQVFMDLSIGPSFAPLMSRRVSSHGEVTAQGLHPQRYDEETKVVLAAPRRLAIHMDDSSVLLPNGSRRPRPPGLQDSASQFVQLTWLFTTQPALLQAGLSITLPLALPRQVEPWIYDVVGPETLFTPAGPVEAVHVKPRRVARPGVDMTAEIWVAPSLQYLPVRILIRQDGETWIDLNIERPPEQAAPSVSPEQPRRPPP